MTLGIAAVYLFDRTYLPLFRLHLTHLRRHTTAPFRIYAAVNRLSEDMRAELAQHLEITPVICKDVPEGARGRTEHAACLRELTTRAFADGCDMVAMLHLDSFPVADGWDDRARKRIAAGAALVTVAPYCFSAGLIVTPDTFGPDTPLPPLTIDAAARETPSVQAFFAAHPDLDKMDSGIGWLLHVWGQGRAWEEWRPASTGAQVFGDEMFHLVAGTRLTQPDLRPFKADRTTQTLRRIGRLVKPVLPKAWVRRLKSRMIDASGVMPYGQTVDKRTELDSLIADPDRYISANRQ